MLRGLTTQVKSCHVYWQFAARIGANGSYSCFGDWWWIWYRNQWRIQKLLVGGIWSTKPQKFGCLHQNWEWFFGRNRKFKRFFRQNQVISKKKKKKKRSSPKLKVIFRPDSLRLGRWGGCIPKWSRIIRNRGWFFRQNRYFYAGGGGCIPPIPPPKSATDRNNFQFKQWTWNILGSSEHQLFIK